MKSKSRTQILGATVLGVAAALMAMPAKSATVGYSFTNVIETTTSMAGSSPWLNLQISDTGTTGLLHFDFTSYLTGTQRATGVFLNLPTTLTSGTNAITISNQARNGVATAGDSPSAFALNPPNLGSNSAWASAQNLTGALASNAGSFDFFVKLPTSTDLTGTQPSGTHVSFDLQFAGSAPTATSFLTYSLPKNSGPSYFAVASFTNTNASGSGVSYIAAVPEPETYAMLVAGLALVGAIARSRGRQA